MSSTLLFIEPYPPLTLLPDSPSARAVQRRTRRLRRILYRTVWQAALNQG